MVILISLATALAMEFSVGVAGCREVGKESGNSLSIESSKLKEALVCLLKMRGVSAAKGRLLG